MPVAGQNPCATSSDEMLIAKVHNCIREQRLIAAGERVCVAVSGGADSVALLRILLDLRSELGVVLSVCHFNHRIRGADADADEQFVKELAEKLALEFYAGSTDVPAFAANHRLSLETAARDLRHQWFAQLLKEEKADKIATAHTQDDQAETVLMRVLRGAGTRGLAGISPLREERRLIRPLLKVTRQEVESYLRGHAQLWREDATNRDLHHLRNRIRHELLPLLQREYNPAIKQTLAELAELARGEEEYWQKELSPVIARLVRSGTPSRSGRSNRDQPTLAVDITALTAMPLAVQRRLLRAMGDQLGVALESKHVQELLALANVSKPSKALALPGGLEAHRTLRELQLSHAVQNPGPVHYCYTLPVPGQVAVHELGVVIRAQIVTLGSKELSRYNSNLLDQRLLTPELIVRNWRAGDRFFPAHTRSPKKVKELLQAGRLGHEVTGVDRKSWPVIESAGRIIWMRGFPAPEEFAATSGNAVLIQELKLD